MPKSKSLFYKYARNLEIVLKQMDIHLGKEGRILQAPYYLCPLSQDIFPEQCINSLLLTREHVPPRSLGGQILCLTSKSANNNADDDVLKKRHEEIILYQTQSKTTAYGYLHTHDAPTKGKKVKIHTYREDEKFILEYIVSPELITYLKNIAHPFSPGVKSTLNYSMLDINHSMDLRAAYIKNAYLKAFAHFGYSLVIGEFIESHTMNFLNGSMNRVRIALTDYNSEILSDIYIMECNNNWPSDNISIATSSDGCNHYLAVPICLKIEYRQKAIVFFHMFGGRKSKPFNDLGTDHELSFTECPNYLDLSTVNGALWFWRNTIN